MDEELERGVRTNHSLGQVLPTLPPTLPPMLPPTLPLMPPPTRVLCNVRDLGTTAYAIAYAAKFCH
eukprot:2493872-Rhodomonas_salina.2